LTLFCIQIVCRRPPGWPLIASEGSLSRPEAVAALAPSRIWFVSVVYPASLQKEISCPGQNVYVPFGHSRGHYSRRRINGLRHSSALSVLHRQNRSASSKPLIHKAFPHPIRGASCVGRLRPQMSAANLGTKRPSLTGNRAGSVTAQGPRRSLGTGPDISIRQATECTGGSRIATTRDSSHSPQKPPGQNATRPGQGRARVPCRTRPGSSGRDPASAQNGISDSSSAADPAAGADAHVGTCPLRPFARPPAAAAFASPAWPSSRPPSICIWSAMISVL